MHTIRDWNDLRGRLEPQDRRCFAFFHPQLVDEPLIFVEIALTDHIPSAIDAVLAENRAPIAPDRATTAVFYSISNCQEGLRGISFGNFLIKQVVEDLQRELPNLRSFVTLSPVPGFSRWLRDLRAKGSDHVFDASDRASFALLDNESWYQDEKTVEMLHKPLVAAGATYLINPSNGSSKPQDPVARFHLGNGARLERINFMGDLSSRGLAQSHGLMVNYLYRPEDIEENHEAYASKGTVVAVKGIAKLARTLPS